MFFINPLHVYSFLEEEIENYKEAFIDYDVDGSGNINILGNFCFFRKMFDNINPIMRVLWN